MRGENDQRNNQYITLFKRLFLLYGAAVILAYINKDFFRVFNNNSLDQRLYPDIPNNETGCIQTSDRSSIMPKIRNYKPSKENLKSLQTKSDKFGASKLHIFIVNHKYVDVIDTLNNFNEYHDLLLNDIDINGRTVAHLAMEVGAPYLATIQFLTHENVVMPDKNGVTLLMLAARGENPNVTKKIIELIGSNRIEQAMNAKDAKGRTWEDWNKMSSSEINENFWNVTVDGSKDAKSCTNSFFFANKRTQLYTPSFPEYTKTAYENAGLEVGTHFVEEDKHVGIKATLENAKKLEEIATSDSEYAVNSRKAIGAVCSDVLTYWSLFSYDKGNEFFTFAGRELPAIIEGFSGQSLVDLYISHQPKNAEVIRTSAKDYTSENETSDKYQKLVCSVVAARQI